MDTVYILHRVRLLVHHDSNLGHELNNYLESKRCANVAFVEYRDTSDLTSDKQRELLEPTSVTSTLYTRMRGIVGVKFGLHDQWGAEYTGTKVPRWISVRAESEKLG